MEIKFVGQAEQRERDFSSLGKISLTGTLP
jgi:hypothetical protein